MKAKTMTALFAAGFAMSAALADARPELLAFPYKTDVTESGSYAAAAEGTDFIVSGSVSGALTIGGPGSLALDVLDDEPCEGKAEDRRRVCDCAVYACL